MHKLVSRQFELQLNASTNRALFSDPENSLPVVGEASRWHRCSDHMVIIAMSSSSLVRSASSVENPLVHSYESAPCGSEDKSGSERVKPFLYEPLTAI